MSQVDGTKVNLGGRDFTVPPLNFAALRRLESDIALIQGLGDVPGPQHIDAIVRIVHAALVRNYPDVTEAEVAELIDMGNLASVLKAVMGISGVALEAAP